MTPLWAAALQAVKDGAQFNGGLVFSGVTFARYV